MAIQYLTFGRIKIVEAFNCTHLAIITDVPHQIWEAITTDGPGQTPIWFTRVMHNKPLFFFLNYARCYFHYLSPHFISQVISPYGFIIVALAVYALWKKGGKAWKITQWLIVLYPMLFLFELQKYI